MAKTKSATPHNVEIEAISIVHGALSGLDTGAQLRVLRYVADMLSISIEANRERSSASHISEQEEGHAAAGSIAQASAVPDELEGISPVAIKWIKRVGFQPADLQSLFSLGGDEIDLVAKNIPGEGKKDRMKNILLLKGVAAYLGTGAARVSFEQLKEACLHYNAYDRSNFSAYIKAFAPEAGGTKESGFTLTARGINSGTELIKNMLGVAR